MAQIHQLNALHARKGEQPLAVAAGRIGLVHAALVFGEIAGLQAGRQPVDEGTLAKIVVPEGTQDVAVNSVIAVLAGEGEDVKAAASAVKTAPAKASEKKVEAAPVSSPRQETARAPAQPAQKPAPAAGEKSPPKVAVGTQQAAHGNRVFSSPLARRLAKEAGIDLGRVQGSGPHGRVIARDIDVAKSGKGLRAPAVGGPQGVVVTPAMAIGMAGAHEPGLEQRIAGGQCEER